MPSSVGRKTGKLLSFKYFMTIHDASLRELNQQVQMKICEFVTL